MAYEGWLLKIGSYTVPHKYLRADSYSPYLNMQDIGDYTDANGYLHREAVDLKVAKIEFETPAGLTNITLTDFLSNIKANYTISKARQFNFTAYIPEYDSYVTQTGYLADFQPNMYWAYDNHIMYDPIRFAIIGGVKSD